VSNVVRILLSALLPALASSVLRAEGAALTADEYLRQVRDRSPAIAASRAARTGIGLKAEEIGMVYSPLFNAGYTFYDDRKESLSLFSPERTRSDSWSLGLSIKWLTGTTTTLSYGLNYAKLFYAPMPPGLPFGSGLLPPDVSYDARPSLTVSQSLLRDFMGGITNSGVQKVRRAAAAGEKAETYRGMSLMFQAEMAYWQLALARRTVEFKRNSLERTIRLKEWTERRANLRLADSADLLQATSAVKLRELDLRMAQQDEANAARQFNTFRGTDGSDAPESLEDIGDRLNQTPADIRQAQERLDVQASREALESARLASDETFYRSLPDLSVFGTVVSNGHGTDAVGANDSAMEGRWPTYTVGVAFIAPLDIFKLSRVREGYNLDLTSAQEAFRKSQLEAGQDWSNLLARWGDVQTRIGLAREILKIQEERLASEQKRFELGRITTYQYLTAEEDFKSAQLTLLRLGLERISIQAQARMYNAGYETNERR